MLNAKFFLNLALCMTKFKVLVLCFPYFKDNSIKFEIRKKSLQAPTIPSPLNEKEKNQKKKPLFRKQAQIVKERNVENENSHQ